MWIQKADEVEQDGKIIQTTMCIPIHATGSMIVDRMEGKPDVITSDICIKVLKMLDTSEALIPFHPQIKSHDELRVITYGCRGWLLWKMGLEQQAKYWAQQCLRIVDTIAVQSKVMGIPLALFCSLEVLGSISSKKIVDIIYQFGQTYPIVANVISHLWMQPQTVNISIITDQIRLTDYKSQDKYPITEYKPQLTELTINPSDETKEEEQVNLPLVDLEATLLTAFPNNDISFLLYS